MGLHQFALPLWIEQILPGLGRFRRADLGRVVGGRVHAGAQNGPVVIFLYEVRVVFVDTLGRVLNDRLGLAQRDEVADVRSVKNICLVDAGLCFVPPAGIELA
ncbi:hypothetical protein D3C83_40350 [compost metagenome]